MTDLMTIENVRGYLDESNTAMLNAERAVSGNARTLSGVLI